MPMQTTIQDHHSIGTPGLPAPRHYLTATIKLTNPDRVVSNDFPVSCHVASTYWLYTDLHGTPPPGESHVFGNTTSLLSKMIPHGKRFTAGSTIRLVPGSIIIFSVDGVAQHSCTAFDDITVAGYNQLDWYSGGQDHAYSRHQINALSPGTGANSKKVSRFSGGVFYDLFQIPEHIAKGFVRNA